MMIAGDSGQPESSTVINLCNYVTPRLLRTDGQSCNCTLFNEDGKHYLLSRVPSYTLCAKYYSYWPDNKLNTINRIYETDEKFNLKYIIDCNLNNQLYEDAKSIGADEVATTIACTVTNLYYIKEALYYNKYKSKEGTNRKRMRSALLKLGVYK